MVIILEEIRSDPAHAVTIGQWEACLVAQLTLEIDC
jgi:hypothetical protein